MCVWGGGGVLIKCCFTSTETVGLFGTGAQDGHLDFHTAPGDYFSMREKTTFKM